MKIRNEKRYKHYWHLFIAALALVIGILSVMDQEWFKAVLSLLMIILEIGFHRDLKKERITQLELNSRHLTISQGDVPDRVIDLDRVSEIPMNEKCARIEFRGEEELPILLRSRDFDSAAWKKVQAALRPVSEALTKERVASMS